MRFIKTWTSFRERRDVCDNNVLQNKTGIVAIIIFILYVIIREKPGKWPRVRLLSLSLYFLFSNVQYSSTDINRLDNANLFRNPR